MFNILVATDIHLGYLENDEVRGDDSFKSFEEVFEIAVENKVDMVLLAGDLFHNNKPSQKCSARCTEILRKYCMGEGAIQFQMISDWKMNLTHQPNFEDENFNVSLPVFSIHGNHDDPTGKNPLSYVEVLSAGGYVNYFGKYTGMSEIEVRPILFSKQQAKIALYGLGSMTEERIHRLFRSKKVRFVRPDEDTDKWFNIFVVHQNRVEHGTKYLPEKFLTNLPHLVIWGHEHESIIDEEYNEEMGFYVIQPGSTVATALCEGESKPKHVCLLTVAYDPDTDSNCFKKEFIPLKTPRQFLFKTIDLDEAMETRGMSRDMKSKENREILSDFMKEVVQEMIDKAEREHSGDDQQPLLPLIRLRVDSILAQPFFMENVGMSFVGKVANPKDVILYKRKRVQQTKTKTNMDSDKLSSLLAGAQATNNFTIEDIVVRYFKEGDSKNLLTMSNERDLTRQVMNFVDKDVTNAIETYLDANEEEFAQRLMAEVDDFSSEELLKNICSISLEKRAQEDKESDDQPKQQPSKFASKLFDSKIPFFRIHWKCTE